jgi:hypothetical protein
MTPTPLKPITNLIRHHYFKTMMVTGLIKSTVGTFLMTIGGSILVYSLVQPGNYAWHAPITAACLIGGGVFVYFIGDVYKVIQKRKEEEQLKQAYISRLEELERNLCNDINELKQCQGQDCHVDGYCKKHEDDE